MTAENSRISSVLNILSVGLVLGLAFLSACGGGGGDSGGPPPPPTPDFSITMQPTSILLVQGTSTQVVVGITPLRGFSSQVDVRLTGMPLGVDVAPSQFTLSPNGQQTVTVTAAMAAVEGSANLSVSGTSGTLQHSGVIALTVRNRQQSVHPPFRTRYLRTDALYDLGFLNFTPQPLILYDPSTRRFFASNTYANRIDVFDAATTLKIAEIPVPGPWVGDFTADHGTIYVGTQVGDLYDIDPVALSVRKRYPGVQIGPAGFDVFEVRVMADGRLALLGSQGGIPAVDGYQRVALWDPATNALTDLTNTTSQQCPLASHIVAFLLTADRMKLVMGSGLSGGSICTYDPVTGAQEYVATDPLGIGLDGILVPPDGTSILTVNTTKVKVYQASDLFEVRQFQVGDGSNVYRCVLSTDGNTLFAFPRLGFGPGFAYDWRTGQQKGWISNFTVHHLAASITPMAMDETGLVAGVIGEGVAFVDTSVLWPTRPTVTTNFGYADTVKPGFGPTSGGTSVQIDNIFFTPDKTHFGGLLATGVTSNSRGISAATPSGLVGPVDVSITTSDGGLVLLPEAYSYGPSIVEVISSASTAEGGGRGLIYGYGFGDPSFNGQAPGLQVSVGGQSAQVTQYAPQPYNNVTFYYPFPLESFEFVVPPGVAGTAADVIVSNSAGSSTAPGAIRYVPSITKYPLPSAVLVQGVYDPRRDLYYFTDATKVQVFSRTQGRWLNPINIPSSVRLWGIAISPDGNRVAVADAGANVIHVYDPDSPGTVSRFSLPDTGANQGGAPCGVAITDMGIVYYMSFYVYYSGGWALHKLDIATGTVTDYRFQAGSFGAGAYSRLVLTPDNARLFGNLDGGIFVLDTATDASYFNPLIAQGDYELTLSSNQTWMAGAGYLMDTNMNPFSYLAYNERQVWYQAAVYGEKLSPSGNLLFLPLVDGIDVVDGKMGTLRLRIELPVTLSPNYDALVVDGRENVLVAITGTNGDGIAVIDLRSLPEPLSLSYAAPARKAISAFEKEQSLKATDDRTGFAGRRTNPAPSPARPATPRRLTNDLIRRYR